MTYRRILITGSEGFLGSHFATELAARHPEAMIWRNDVLHINPVHQEVGLEGTDCRELFNWRHPLSSMAFDLVVHCAGIVGGRRNIERNPLAIAENLAIDADLFRWAVKARPGRILYLSSSAVYPVDNQTAADPMRLTEEMQWCESDYWAGVRGEPDSIYGWSKLTGERLAQEVNAAGVPVHVVRPFSGYGTDQDLDYPFPSFIRRAVLREDPFEIWGDGTQVRDFIHVDDLVAGALAVVDADYREPVNLCTGVPTSFNQLAEMVIAHAGGNYRPQIKHLPAEPTGVAYRVGDPTLLRRAFYSPQITIGDGVTIALNTLSPSDYS